MTFSILAYSLFTGCGYFATEPWHLGLFFFLAALGLGGQWSLGVALVMECWPEKARPLLSGVIGAAANVGFLMIATVAWVYPPSLEDGWRWMMIVGASPAVLALFVIFLVPESKRWQDATKKGGGSPIIEIFKPGLRRKTLLAIAFSAIPLIGTWAVSGFLPNWINQMAENGGIRLGHLGPMAQILALIGAIISCVVMPVLGGIGGGGRSTSPSACSRS